MLSFLHSNPVVDIKIKSDPSLKQRCRAFVETDLPIFQLSDQVQGHVTVKAPPGKEVSHRGLEISLVGEFKTPKDARLGRFFQRKQILRPPGEFTGEFESDFAFDHLQFPTTTYYGTIANVYYAIRFKVVHRVGDFVVDQPLMVVGFKPIPVPSPVNKEIGIRNILHLEFVFPKLNWDVRECVVGAVYFILVKLRIIFMSLTLYRNEIYEDRDEQISRRTVLKTYEIMDGSPVRGDNIPIRFFLGHENVWPFHSFQGSALKVEHYLRAQLIDENGKQYFKKLMLEFGRFEPVSVTVGA
jgi:vacuolar protein sorting-associated protein 26